MLIFVIFFVFIVFTAIVSNCPLGTLHSPEDSGCLEEVRKGNAPIEIALLVGFSENA